MRAGRIDWAFLVLFGAIYAALYVGYSLVPDAILRERVYFQGIVRPAGAVINWVLPGEGAIGTQNQLRSRTANLAIVRGCDGSGVVFLLVAAMAAFRAGWRTTAVGIAGALVLVYVLNELRIIGLYFITAHRPDLFTPMHVYFIPTFMVLVATLYFAAWVGHDQHGAEYAAQD